MIFFTYSKEIEIKYRKRKEIEIKHRDMNN